MTDSIFNNPDLYPTPIEVINKMFLYSSCAGKIVLEPSAGTGNIVDYLKAMNASNVIACESNDKLRQILQNKCDIISNDFLTVKSEDISHIDMIVMNPPFRCGHTHIQHAFDIAPSGCEILALCNLNTITNSFSKERKSFKELIDLYGSYEDLSACFVDSERKTNVDVAFIRLFKPISEESDTSEYFSMTDEDSIDKNDSGIVSYNYVQDIVSRYVQSIKLYDNVAKCQNEINECISALKSNISFVAKCDSHEDRYVTITFDTFKKMLQKSAWALIFDKLNMKKYITKGVREDLNKFIEKQSSVPFTVKNIYAMIHMIVGTNSDRIDKVLVEAFELICSFSADNSTAGDKWRTNSNYKINKKFIVPWICEYDNNWPKPYVHIDYRKGEEIDDIVKALCFLTGKQYQTNYQNTLRGFFNENNIPWGEWVIWGDFFRVKGFKKKTMHFEFLDDKVCHEFNIRVAKAKGWRLPSDTKSGPRVKSTDVTLF